MLRGWDLVDLVSGFFGLFRLFGWERDKPDKPNQPDKLSANRPSLHTRFSNTAVDIPCTAKAWTGPTMEA